MLTACAAKTGSKHVEPGTQPLPPRPGCKLAAVGFNLTVPIVQREPRCMVIGGQDPTGVIVHSNQMFVPQLFRVLSMLIRVDIGLQVLDSVIMTKWKVLPREQCQGI